MIRSCSNSYFIRILAIIVVAVPGTHSTHAAQLATNLALQADVTLKETFDSNVYLQDVAPTNHVPGAVSAMKSSLVTTILPRLALDWKPCPAFNVLAAYAPEIALYASAEDENNITHRGTLNLGGKIEGATWELLDAETFIEGSDIGPTFARPEDVPPIGGIPLRDRREAFISRNSFRVTVPAGRWFFRPAVTYYYHDFMTKQRLNPSATSGLFCYENYLDRRDVNGGLDIGFDAGGSTFLVLGYRYGRQDQFVGPNASNSAFTDSPFDSTYHRVLFGVEGAPASWIKLNFQIGPEFRRFGPGTPAGFDRDEMLYYVDGSVTLLPDKADLVAFRWTRYEQPAFSSQSVYEDIKYDVAWRHKLTDKLTASAGFTLYIGKWQPPVNRDDWIYTPSVGLTFLPCKHVSAEFIYSCDLVANLTPTKATGAKYADAREYSRHLVSLALKYAF